MKVYPVLIIFSLLFCLQQCGNYQPTLNIHDAVLSGSTVAVRQALIAGGDVNETDNAGQTPLDLALRQGNTDILELLIENGAEINARGGYVLTSLLFRMKLDLAETILKKGVYIDDAIDAMKYDTRFSNSELVEIVKLMLEHGNTMDGSQQSLKNKLLHLSALKGDRYLIQLLRDAGAELYPGYLTEDELVKLPKAERTLFTSDVQELKTALNQAAQGGHLDLVKEFQEEGVPLDGAFAFALMNGQTKVVEYILQQDIDWNKENQNHPFMPHYLFYQDEATQTQLFNVLVENGLLDEDNHEFAHPLFMLSVERGSSRIFHTFLEHGFDVMQSHEDIHDNLLKRSLWSGNFENVKLIMDQGGSELVQSRGAQGILADVLASSHGEPFQSKTFDYLLEHGADIHQTDHFQGTLLHMAVEKSNRNIVELCLEKRLDVNAKRADGVTPLITAAIKGDLESIKLLLKHGADKEMQDNEGKTALDYAREFEDEEMIHLLLGEN